jgi:hypothetical protein
MTRPVHGRPRTAPSLSTRTLVRGDLAANLSHGEGTPLRHPFDH